ncbi:hypothetical protein CRG98_048123 [Punica granatum]|uniref:Uncharacterized protein n=1 Tax=Punica granatum TaxID=22663 RepID=A0A2I0HJH7_PUNGR|nr:hypothetical protein CRG98_048123 [Punica granatum]
MTNSSRWRVRVVRNPLNVMARLADVVRRNGASRSSVCTARGSRGLTLFTAGTRFRPVSALARGRTSCGSGLGFERILERE